MRRLIAVGLIVAVLAVAWSAGWFALAAWADQNVAEGLERLEARGVEVDCRDRDVVGFPFAIKVACARTVVTERSSSSAAEFAGVTGGASVFAPRTAQIALASPAEIESPLLASPAQFGWSDADLDVGMTLSGPRSISFDGSDISGTVPLVGSPPTGLTATSATATLASSGSGRSDADFSFAGLQISAGDATFPPIDGEGSARLSLEPEALLSGRGELEFPLSAQEISVSLASGAARLQAGGELSVDAEGILDGTITLRLAGMEGLQAFIAALPAEYQKFGNAIVGGMLAFGQPASLDGEPASELAVTIARGRAKVGLVEIAVPRIRL